VKLVFETKIKFEP